MFLKLVYLLSKLRFSGKYLVLEHRIAAGQLSGDNSSTKTLYCLNSVSPRMNTIASREQFKPIRIGENLEVNYN